MTLMQSEGLIEVQDQQEMLAILGRNDELLRNCCFWSVRVLPLPRTMCVTAYA